MNECDGLEISKNPRRKAFVIIWGTSELFCSQEIGRRSEQGAHWAQAAWPVHGKGEWAFPLNNLVDGFVDMRIWDELSSRYGTHLEGLNTRAMRLKGVITWLAVNNKESEAFQHSRHVRYVDCNETQTQTIVINSLYCIYGCTTSRSSCHPVFKSSSLQQRS